MENMVNNTFWHKKKVFITGHNGFKGSWLTLWLQTMGCNVAGYSLIENHEDSLCSLLQLDSHTKTYHGDIRDQKALESAIEEFQPEIIFHLAAQPLVRKSYEYPVDTYSTNVMGTVHTLQAINHVDSVQAVVVVSSDKCYENQERDWSYSESDCLGGNDPYSCSKACVELVAKSYQHYFTVVQQRKNLSIATVRAGNVIGGGDWGEDRLIPDIMRSILHNNELLIRYPKAVRPWQFVLEPLRGYIMVAEALVHNGEPYAQAWNFGPSRGDLTPVDSIVNQIYSLWPHHKPWKQPQEEQPHECQLLMLDCSKAQNRLGWKPILNLPKTLQLTVDWYRHYQKKRDSIRHFTEQQILYYLDRI